MDAVSWHSLIAQRFDSRYDVSSSFGEQLDAWRGLIARYANPSGATLDAGCGSGVLACVAAEYSNSVFAFDASPAMIEIANQRIARERRAKVTLAHGSLGDPGLLGGQKFDLVLCSSVLEYLPDYWSMIDWLADALSPEGALLFSLPNGASPYRRAERACFALTGRPRYLRHVRHCPKFSSVEAGLSERGFAVADVKYYGYPVLRRVLRNSRLAANLFVIAARRAAYRRSEAHP